MGIFVLLSRRLLACVQRFNGQGYSHCQEPTSQSIRPSAKTEFEINVNQSMKQDFPHIGQRRHGMVLVCQGDDQPDQYATWLQPLAEEFLRLSEVASKYGIKMKAGDGTPPVESVLNFCERIGVEFHSNMWEGSFVSGVYHLGWIKAGTVRSAKTDGRKLIKALVAQTEVQIRAAVIRELQSIKDFDEFLECTTNDRHDLHQKIASSSSSLQATQSSLEALNDQAQKRVHDNTMEIDRACVLLASALLAGERCRLVAGPLVLWNDGVLYAICSWGGTPIPKDSSPAILLSSVEKSGRQVVRVTEKTVIGGWLNGAIYRRGPADINGWANVWAHREIRPRSFLVDKPEFFEKVQLIHNALALNIPQ